MQFISSLISKKLMVTAAAEAWLQTLHMSADAKGQWTALIALVFVVAQAWEDSQVKPAQAATPAPPATPAPATSLPSPTEE